MRDHINLVESLAFKEIKAPEQFKQFDQPKVFLAGSIDEGKAEPWQARVCEELSNLPVIVLNPRREDWDASWEQDISNPGFNEQVSWELDGLDAADVIALYFDKNGKAPISLLELGLHAASGKIIACCPEGYWRRGNVQMVCDRYGLELVENLDELISSVRTKLENEIR